MSKKIPISKKGFALVSDSDYDSLSLHNWHLDYKGYAYRKGGTGFRHQTIFMHRVIMNAPKGMQVDHINGNKLDNRRDNLRLATNAQNHANRGVQSNNKSGFKGVSYDKGNKKWRAQIRCDGKARCIGFYSTPKEAAIAYNEAALKYHGEFARLNEID